VAAIQVQIRPSKTPHDMTPTTLGIETMNASSVRCTRIDVTVRSPESCNLSNFDKTAEIFGGMITMA
jgi:hypothetical protein